MKKCFICTVIVLFSCFIRADKKIINENIAAGGIWNFKLEKIWSIQSAGKQVIARIGSFSIDDKNNVYILDGPQYKVLKFDEKGVFKMDWGKKGEGPGEFQMPFNLFVLDKLLIVGGLNKIHYFTHPGKYLKSINTAGKYQPRKYIDKTSFLDVVTDHGSRGAEKKERLIIYNIDERKGKTICSFEAEEMLKSPSLSTKEASITSMVILHVHNREIYFGKNDHYNIKKMNMKGDPILNFSIKGKEHKRVTKEGKDKFLSNFQIGGHKLPKHIIKQFEKVMPSQSTFFNHIQCDPNGLIYVFNSDLQNYTGYEIDVFSKGGRYLYQGILRYPEGKYKTNIKPVLKNRHLYSVVEDSEGEQELIKFRINLPDGNIKG